MNADNSTNKKGNIMKQKSHTNIDLKSDNDNNRYDYERRVDEELKVVFKDQNVVESCLEKIDIDIVGEKTLRIVIPAVGNIGKYIIRMKLEDFHELDEYFKNFKDVTKIRDDLNKRKEKEKALNVRFYDDICKLDITIPAYTQKISDNIQKNIPKHTVFLSLPFIITQDYLININKKFNELEEENKILIGIIENLELKVSNIPKQNNISFNEESQKTNFTSNMQTVDNKIIDRKQIEEKNINGYATLQNYHNNIKIPNQSLNIPDIFGKGKFQSVIIKKDISISPSSIIKDTEEELFTVLKKIKRMKGKEINKLNFIYRASEEKDGGKAKRFHEKCKGKKNTLILIKTKKDFRFGGFTINTWDSNDPCIDDDGYKTSNDDFIFALKKTGGAIIYPNKATKLRTTRCLDECGPIFGNDFRIGDNFLKEATSWTNEKDKKDNLIYQPDSAYKYILSENSESKDNRHILIQLKELEVYEVVLS